MKEWCVSLRARINRDANGAAQIRSERCAEERKSRASFQSINFPNDPDWIYRQVGRNQLLLRIPTPLSLRTGLNEDESGRIPSAQTGRKREALSLSLAEEIRSNFNILLKKEKGSNHYVHFSRRSILQCSRKLRYEFPSVTRNVRYGSRCEYLRGRFLSISS